MRGQARGGGERREEEGVARGLRNEVQDFMGERVVGVFCLVLVFSGFTPLFDRVLTKPHTLVLLPTLLSLSFIRPPPLPTTPLLPPPHRTSF